MNATRSPDEDSGVRPRSAAEPHPAGAGFARVAAAVVVAAALALPRDRASAQLRPLDPLDWELFEGQGMSFSVGFAHFWDQRASLAGTEGRLLELGSFRGTWATGQAAIMVSGTALRVFQDQSVFAAPQGRTRPFTEEARVDAGDHRLSTMVLLTPAEGAWDAAVRFGVRLPTTDDGQGLERDQTDFFATLGGRYVRGALAVSGELGVGVLGTRDPRQEQVDPILFSLDLTYDFGWVRSDLELVGQRDPRKNPELRGNEDLGEGRLGFRFGSAPGFRVAFTRGWETFSPGFGILVEVAELR